MTILHVYFAKSELLGHAPSLAVPEADIKISEKKHQQKHRRKATVIIS
jgi:hypothetical protein